MRHHLLGRAVSAAIPDEDKQKLHIAVLEHLQRTRAGAMDRLANHAVQGGVLDLATRLYLGVADELRRNHCYIEAEEQYTQALEYLTENQPERGHALAGRGHVRARLQRLDEALADIRQARSLAEDRADHGEQVKLLLQEAGLLDWCSQWKAAAGAAELALSRVQRLDSDHLYAALHLACGRAQLRREHFADAVELLTSAMTYAETIGDREIHTAAQVCLAPALFHADRTDEAKTHFEQIEARCEKVGDTFHLALAYINRRGLSLLGDDIERMIEELQSAQQKGRQLGNAQLERLAALQLAEGLYWYGWYDEAVAVAERARHLYLELMSGYPSYEDHLLLARIYGSRQDKRAREHMTWLDSNIPVSSYMPSARALVAMVRLTLSATDDGQFDHDAWLKVETRLRHPSHRALRIELLITAAEALAHNERYTEAIVWLQRARELAGKSRLWQARLDTLTSTLAAATS